MNPELYWIDGPWLGKVAISGRPRGGDWLEDEVQGWKDAHIDTVVSFLTADEERALGLEDEAGVAKLKGIAFIGFPVPDRSVPDDFGKSVELVRALEQQLAAGKNVALHCRQGIGRSAVLAAALVVSAGLEPDRAFASLRAARGCAVPETAEQRDWVIRLSHELVPAQR